MADMQLVDYLRLENYEAGGKYLCSLTPEEGARQICALKNLKDQTVALRMLLGEKGGSRVFYALPEEKRCELADTISDNELADLYEDCLNHGIGIALEPFIDRMDARDIVELLSRISVENLRPALHLLDVKKRAEVFAATDPVMHRELAAQIDLEEKAVIYAKLAAQDDHEAMAEMLHTMDNQALAEFFQSLDSSLWLETFRMLPLPQRAAVYALMKREMHDQIYHDLDRDELWELLNEMMRHGARGYNAIKQEFLEMPPFDIAEFVGELEDERQLPLAFKLMNKDTAAEVFTYLDQPVRRKLIEAIGNKKTAEWINEMATDDAVDFLQELPSNMVNAILKEVPGEDREIINNFLRYPESSAGSLMTPEFIALRGTMTCRDALKVIRDQGVDSETIYTCYVVDDARHLQGFVTLRKILFATPETLIESIMAGRQKTVAVETLDDQESVAARFKEYDVMAMPVVDQEDRLCGIITADDIMDVLVAEQTEDVETMAGIKPSQGTGYLNTGIFQLARNRIGWLLVLMIGATFTGIIINRCEALLSHFTSLAAFLPLLMDTCGNSGSQSSTLIVRGIAVGEVDVCDWLQVLWREMRVGIICAAVLAVVNFIRIAILDQCGWQSSTWQVNLVVNITLFVTVVIAKLIGGSLPLLAKLVRADPALMASPALTTCVDTVTLILYFACAKLLLPVLGAV